MYLFYKLLARYQLLSHLAVKQGRLSCQVGWTNLNLYLVSLGVFIGNYSTCVDAGGRLCRGQHSFPLKRASRAAPAIPHWRGIVFIQK